MRAADLATRISDATRKRRVARSIDPHAFESVGDILRRMRLDAEAQMASGFSRLLSLQLDLLLAFEQRLIEEPGD